ncbi:MAG: glycosyltransferase family 39 protein [Acidobacteriota bacterium]
MKPFRLLTLAVFAAATLPRLAHRGMFVDGVTYASIARNLAQGRGSFWSPAYTATLYPQFHEHPPLGFWLQSLWFRVFGDHLFVERLYALMVGLATAALIAAIYRQLHADTLPEASPLGVGNELPGPGPETRAQHRSGAGVGPSRSKMRRDEQRLASAGNQRNRHGSPRQAADLAWLPVLLWIAVPVVSWAMVGNMLETTVALFTTAAVAAAVKAVLQSGSGARPPASAVAWSVLSGLGVVGASLTKGPVGLFPLAAPAMLLLLPNGRRVWRLPLVQWTTVIVCALLLWEWGTARASLTEYFNQQVMAALAGEREVSRSSFTIVKALLQGVMLPMLAAGMLAVAAAGRWVAPSHDARSRAVVFLLMGLAGTLPILVSTKQAGHYLVPAVPLFTLATALAVGPTAMAAAQRLGTQGWRTILNIATGLVVLGTVAGSLAPGLGRDRERLADLDALAAAVPLGQIVGLCPESNSDWGLHAWFERQFRVSLDAADGARRDWFLETERAKGACVPAACTAATDPRRPLVLMKCRRAD